MSGTYLRRHVVVVLLIFPGEHTVVLVVDEASQRRVIGDGWVRGAYIDDIESAAISWCPYENECKGTMEAVLKRAPIAV